MANDPTKRLTASGRVTWRLRWRYGGTRDGAWQSVTLRTQREALDLKRAVEDRRHMVKASDPEVRDGSILPGREPTKTTRDAALGRTWAEVSKEWYDHRTGVRAQTEGYYGQVLRDHLTPRWGERPIASLTQKDAAMVVREYRIEKGNGRGGHIWSIMRAVFTYAIAHGDHPGPHPCDGLRLYDRKGGKRAVFLSRAEVARIEAAADRHAGDDWGLFVRLTNGSGMRLSEVSGLYVEDLLLEDENAPAVLVDHALRREHGIMVDGPTKNGKDRTIPIEASLGVLLRAHVAGKEPGDRVFTNPSGGPLSERTVDGRWQRTLKRAKVRKCRFHDLRHTYASHLLEEGVPLKAVSEVMGHSSVKVTGDVYGHIGPNSASRIREALAGTEQRHLRAV